MIFNFNLQLSWLVMIKVAAAMATTTTNQWGSTTVCAYANELHLQHVASLKYLNFISLKSTHAGPHLDFGPITHVVFDDLKLSWTIASYSLHINDRIKIMDAGYILADWPSFIFQSAGLPAGLYLSPVLRCCCLKFSSQNLIHRQRYLAGEFQSCQIIEIAK